MWRYQREDETARDRREDQTAIHLRRYQREEETVRENSLQRREELQDTYSDINYIFLYMIIKSPVRVKRHQDIKQDSSLPYKFICKKLLAMPNACDHKPFIQKH